MRMTLALLGLLLSWHSSQAALNVETDAPENFVRRLRESIFIDTAYLSEREEESCSSLDGPKCMAFMLRRGSPQPAVLDGPGVLPDRMLRELGSSQAPRGFDTPLYHDLEVLRQELLAGEERATALVQRDDAAAFRSSRAEASHGALHFGDLPLDKKVPLSFSRGLPNGVVATWDGPWTARHCFDIASRPEKSWGFLPAPGARDVPAAAGALASPAATVAELSGAVGYLRFSRPMVVRSLLARWRPHEGAPPAMVAGRLGLETRWATHVDPEGLQGWIDIAGGSLEPVDEVAFFAVPGMELATLWGVAHPKNSSENDERPAILIEPAHVMGELTFGLKVSTISPAGTPFLMSLQEAIDRNLRLHTEPSAWGAPHSHGAAAKSPSIIASESAALTGWTEPAIANQGMLQHQLIAPIFGRWPQKAGFMIESLQQASELMPASLRKVLKDEQHALAEAVQTWLSNGGKWSRTLPITAPLEGSEQHVQRYVRAKTLQTKLDLLTAAFLYWRPQLSAFVA